MQHINETANRLKAPEGSKKTPLGGREGNETTGAIEQTQQSGHMITKCQSINSLPDKAWRPGAN